MLVSLLPLFVCFLVLPYLLNYVGLLLRDGSPKQPYYLAIISNTITALYDHQPAILENIRRETVAILNDAMVQRGFPKAIICYICTYT